MQYTVTLLVTVDIVIKWGCKKSPVENRGRNVLDFLCKKQAETIAESAILWYNICMTKHKYNQEYYTPIQMKISVDLEIIIEISDPIYTFNKIIDKVDTKKIPCCGRKQGWSPKN